jgi:hypothetical protein
MKRNGSLGAAYNFEQCFLYQIIVAIPIVYHNLYQVANLNKPVTLAALNNQCLDRILRLIRWNMFCMPVPGSRGGGSLLHS